MLPVMPGEFRMVGLDTDVKAYDLMKYLYEFIILWKYFELKLLIDAYKFA